MCALIIGGDRLGNITDELYKKGFTDIRHISGRKGGEKKVSMLLEVERADLTIVLVDYINHVIVNNLKNKVNKLNKSNKSSVIYARRSWSHMEKYVNNFVVNNK